MRILDTARFATLALRRAPLRTGMMLLAIAIGVSAVVALTAVGEGARRYVTAEFSALGTNTLIVLPGKADTSGAGLTGMLIGETARDLTLDDAEAILRSPAIVRIAPIIVGAGTATWGPRLRDVTVLGTNSAMQSVQHWEMQSGRFLPELDLDVASPVCVIGDLIAKEVVAAAQPVGEWLRIGDTRCRVLGVLAQGGMTGAFNIDETVILPIALAQQIFNAHGVFRIITETRERTGMDAARRDIIRIVKERHQGIEDITVITQDAVLSTFDAIFDVITMALAAIAAISLLVAGVLIMNVMLVAVSQRTSEIGLLKAIGATQGQIVWLFLTEATWLAALGGVIGLTVGYSAAFGLRSIYPALDFQAPAWASAAAMIIALACGIVFGLAPARRAARLDPVLALQKR
jgi:putative ABC transport system permease protein